MNPERWARLQELLAAAWELPAPARPAYLEKACDDAQLRRDAASILAAEEGSETFLSALAESAGLRWDDEPEVDLAGRRVGNYRLLEPLGRGGMGVVYLAERADGAFEHQVAVKLLAMGLAGREGRARFVAERQILAGLEHPAIARLLDGGVTDDATPYFVMELVEGERIDTWCDARRLGVRDRIELLCRVCGAVEYAHRRLIVHRDLKPANVLVTDAGDPKLLDFGVAKLLSEVDPEGTRVRTAVPLTPAWAAPEQLAGAAVTTATDTYALGALAYYLLIGVPPRDSEEATPVAAMRQLRSQAAPPSRRFGALAEPARAAIAHARDTTEDELRRCLAGDLDAVLLRALADEPERRYGSAGELAADFEAYLAGRPVAARPPRLGYRLNRFVGRHRLAVAAAGVVALVLAALVVVSVLSALHNRRLAERVIAERDRAEEVTAFLVDLFEVSEPERAQGREITARELLAVGDEQIRTRLADQPETRAAMLAALGRVYRRLGEPERAVGDLREALRLYRDLGEVGTPQVPELLQELGAARADQWQWDEAKKYFRRAVNRYRRLYGQNDPRVADALAQFGSAMASAGVHYEEAEPVLREALELQRQAYGDDDIRVASTLTVLGVSAGHRGRFDEVEELLARATAIYRRRPDAITAEYASALNMLSIIAIKRREFDKADEIVCEGLRVFDRLYGPDHSQTSAMLHVASWLAAERGDLDAAERYIRDSLRILEALAEPRPVDATMAWRRLSQILARQGELVEAEGAAHRSLEFARASGDALQVVDSLRLLGVTLRDEGRFADARRAFDEVLGDYADELPAGHPSISLAVLEYGVLAGREGKWSEAEDRLRRALELYLPFAASDSTLLATIRLELARVLVERDGDREATELLAQARPILEAAFAADDSRVRDANALGAGLASRPSPLR